MAFDASALRVHAELELLPDHMERARPPIGPGHSEALVAVAAEAGRVVKRHRRRRGGFGFGFSSGFLLQVGDNGLQLRCAGVDRHGMAFTGAESLDQLGFPLAISPPPP